MILNIQLKLQSMVTQTARIARDLWRLVIDTWDNEHRKFQDIV